MPAGNTIHALLPDQHLVEVMVPALALNSCNLSLLCKCKMRVTIKPRELFKMRNLYEFHIEVAVPILNNHQHNNLSSKWALSCAEI